MFGRGRNHGKKFPKYSQASFSGIVNWLQKLDLDDRNRRFPIWAWRKALFMMNELKCVAILEHKRSDRPYPTLRYVEKDSSYQKIREQPPTTTSLWLVVVLVVKWDIGSRVSCERGREKLMNRQTPFYSSTQFLSMKPIWLSGWVPNLFTGPTNQLLHWIIMTYYCTT